MKKSFFVAALALAMTACSSLGEKSDYQLTVENKSLAEGDMVYLIDFDTQEKVDSVVVADSVAVFKGVAKTPFLAQLVSNGNRLGSIFIEPGELSLKNGGLAEGGKLNEDMNKLETDLATLTGLYHEAEDDETRQEIVDRYNATIDSVLKANIDNPIGYYLFVQQANSMEPEELKAALEENPHFADFKRVQKVQKTFEAKEATAPGKKFTDFEIEYDGNITRLSDYVGNGNYTLVDFWASWCGPCRREASTTLKDIYAEYADKGLEIVGIAVWDEPENTLNAIEAMQLPWKQVINGQTVPTDAYGILGIPCIILFGPDGTIISRDLQGDDLKASVAEAMANVENK